MADPIVLPLPVETDHSQRWEKKAIILLAVLIVALKLGYIHNFAYNSDEAQHLHVAWGWTQGLVQYRDFFDNHTPLFHLLMAPLVRQVGERAHILFWMRLAMLPLWALSLGCIGWMGTRLYSPRTGLWATLLAASSSLLLCKGTEFRADILWMAGWFLLLAVGLAGRFTHGRALAVGLLLGAVFGVSMKTSLLLVALLSALGLLWALLPQPQRSAFLKHSGGKILPALGGLCVAPLAIAAFFDRQHALPALISCVFQHNTRVATSLGSGGVRRVGFLLLLPIILWAGRAILRHGPDWKQNARRTLVFLIPALFLLDLICFWPGGVTPQDYLPALPLLAIPLAAFLGDKRNSATLLLLVAILQLSVAVGKKSPFRQRTAGSKALVANVLRLTKPSDFVMDAKGETIFRRRPFYYVLETITMRCLQLGVIPDTIAQEMVKTRTCVTLINRLPDKTKQWVERYYVPVNDLRPEEQIWVAGCWLPAVLEPTRPVTRRFEVAIDAEYVVAAAKEPVPGMMDGVSCIGPVFLRQGPHTFSCADPRPLAVFWAQAAATGFQPFPHRSTLPH